MLIKLISAFGADNNNILTSKIAAVISDDIIKAPLLGNLWEIETYPCVSCVGVKDEEWAKSFIKY